MDRSQGNKDISMKDTIRKKIEYALKGNPFKSTSESEQKEKTDVKYQKLKEEK